MSVLDHPVFKICCPMFLNSLKIKKPAFSSVVIAILSIGQNSIPFIHPKWYFFEYKDKNGKVQEIYCGSYNPNYEEEIADYFGVRVEEIEEVS